MASRDATAYAEDNRQVPSAMAAVEESSTRFTAHMDKAVPLYLDWMTKRAELKRLKEWFRAKHHEAK